mmetsp:Transcript_36378/g.102529  ORF Transcript_36378/g.102529 Transcript_36378/m.102529 type:complete len:308 (+) Transcript_36378:295-1218(+)
MAPGGHVREGQGLHPAVVVQDGRRLRPAGPREDTAGQGAGRAGRDAHEGRAGGRAAQAAPGLLLRALQPAAQPVPPRPHRPARRPARQEGAVAGGDALRLPLQLRRPHRPRPDRVGALQAEALAVRGARGLQAPTLERRRQASAPGAAGGAQLRPGRDCLGRGGQRCSAVPRRGPRAEGEGSARDTELSLLRPRGAARRPVAAWSAAPCAAEAPAASAPHRPHVSPGLRPRGERRVAHPCAGRGGVPLCMGQVRERRSEFHFLGPKPDGTDTPRGVPRSHRGRPPVFRRPRCSFSGHMHAAASANQL